MWDKDGAGKYYNTDRNPVMRFMYLLYRLELSEHPYEILMEHSWHPIMGG